jgi:DNA-binding NtrC family response regulator
VLLTSGDVLLPENLHFPTGGHDVDASPHESPEDLTLDQVERRHIERMLARSGGRVAEVARRLGVPRSSLYDEVKRHVITLSESRTAG